MEARDRLWSRSARAAFTGLLPSGHVFPDPQPDRIRASLEDPAVAHYVAEEAGELIGFTVCGVSRDDDGDTDTGEIRTFFVAPEYWRRGVGRTLMDSALGELRRRGYRHATVWSFAANGSANAFYEAAGFARDGAERTEAVWADLVEVRYGRPLA